MDGNIQGGGRGYSEGRESLKNRMKLGGES